MEPFITNIESRTLYNSEYRRVLHTSGNMQLVVMSIKPGEDIGMEVHPNTDQFIRVEHGTAESIIGKTSSKISTLSDGVSITIPKGVWHNIKNIGDCELKLYTIYSPPNHKPGTVQPIKPLDDQDGGNIQNMKSYRLIKNI